jgi:hypothetical protein
VNLPHRRLVVGHRLARMSYARLAPSVPALAGGSVLSGLSVKRVCKLIEIN